ncbi:MAG: hypothetical protein K2Q03_00545 [Sphingobacteriaceae bacterium]|jgi:hypothetical protein|nr:hypothetical protein [Sphingobacteriaceae bacterium]
MDNNSALNLIINYHKQIKDDIFYIICDLNYNVLVEDGSSAALANIEGKTFLGKKLVPELSKAIWRTRLVEQILKSCIASKKSSEWLSLRFSRQQEYWLIQLNYIPLINFSTGEVIGIKVSASPIKYPLYLYPIESIITAGKGNYKLDEVNNGEFLSSTEQEVLFLTYHTANYEEIAYLMSLAHNEVFNKTKISRINSKLLEKYECANIEELKVITYQKGLHIKFPVSLVGEFMFPVKTFNTTENK